MRGGVLYRRANESIHLLYTAWDRCRVVLAFLDWIRAFVVLEIWVY